MFEGFLFAIICAIFAYLYINEKDALFKLLWLVTCIASLIGVWTNNYTLTQTDAITALNGTVTTNYHYTVNQQVNDSLARIFETLFGLVAFIIFYFAWRLGLSGLLKR